MYFFNLIKGKKQDRVSLQWHIIYYQEDPLHKIDKSLMYPFCFFNMFGNNIGVWRNEGAYPEFSGPLLNLFIDDQTNN